MRHRLQPPSGRQSGLAFTLLEMLGLVEHRVQPKNNEGEDGKVKMLKQRKLLLCKIYYPGLLILAETLLMIESTIGTPANTIQGTNTIVSSKVL